MKDNFYKYLIKELPIGYAYFKTIFDEQHFPCDYEFIEANQIFTQNIGIVSSDIEGKRASVVLPDFKQNKFNWLKYFEAIAVNGEEEIIEGYSEPLKKWYKLYIKSPEKSHFIVYLIDISKEKNSIEKYRLLTEFNSDVIWILNIAKKRFTYVSPSVYFLRGFTSEEVLEERIQNSFTKESYLKIINIIKQSVEEFMMEPEMGKSFITEVQQTCKNGQVIWVEVSAKCRYNSDGEVEIIGVSRNIEDRKKSQDEVLYLSYHDQLTGLYNRRFYEEEIKRLNQKENLPLTIVMADVNGLKLINDSFGHAKGDELIQKVTEVILKGCRKKDMVARLGGDEFIIILPNTEVIEANKIIKQMKHFAAMEKVGSIDVSISFGYETKYYNHELLEDIYKKAEDHMYKKKLFESPSMRGKTINTIIRTLHEKNRVEEQHAHRVSHLCESIAIALELNDDKVEEIKTVGLLHDIGKIAIDENVLNKPGTFTEEERREIERHSEIGYRILSTDNSMSEMAEYVLHHHEKWDGTGYPKGLKGEEIPLESRIITLADAFDVMTSERTYRTIISEEAAMDEIQKKSGTKFDPELVNIFIEKVMVK